MGCWRDSLEGRQSGGFAFLSHVVSGSWDDGRGVGLSSSAQRLCSDSLERKHTTWMAGSRQQTAARARTFTGTKLTATQKKTWQGEVLRSKTGALSPADPWSSSASDGGQAQFTTHPLLAWLL
jgi:hypothetical protein